MPCNCDGYSEPRAMNPAEQWVSLSRHHIALEKETESLRALSQVLWEKLKEIKNVIPGVDFSGLPDAPPKTPDWNGTTYRDAGGKWPNDIHVHLDWLSDQDYGRASE